MVLYGATLRGEALVLGAYQRAADALSAQARQRGPVLRRETGGISLRAGDGIVYVALGLHDRSALMPCPRLRILNRNVRGALAGLRSAGCPAHYFGRDFVSVDARPAAFAGWSARADGRVLLEFFIAESSSYLPPPEANGYPSRANDPFRGKEILTLQEASAQVQGVELIQKVFGGYGAGFALQWREVAPPVDAAATASDSTTVDDETVDAALSWSAPREEVIGFVSGGVALDSSGKLRALRLAGDFFQDRLCADALSRVLAGATPSAEQIGRAIDDVYARGERELEGVRDLNSLREVLLDAVALETRRSRAT